MIRWEFDANEVLRATSEYWDLSGPLPVPWWHVQLSCPVCGYSTTTIRWWQTHSRPDSVVRHRVDVSMKCCRCAAIWMHGVAVPDAWWRKWGHPKPGHIPRDKGRRMLEEAGIELQNP